MIAKPPTLIVPLEEDERGAIRVSNTRVTLDTLIARHHQGDSPEAIHTGFPTIPLTDIYAVIAYYLANQDEVDSYLRRRDEEAERIRQEIEANYTPEQQMRTQYFKDLLNQKRQNQ
jgi:uncharacterized protein (DUF433 family)